MNWHWLSTVKSIGLLMASVKATTARRRRSEAWREKAPGRTVALTCKRLARCYVLPLLFAPVERFAIRFKAQAHCLLPQGFTPPSLSTMTNAASGRSETRCYGVRRADCATPDALDGSSSAPRIVNHARLPLCPGPARESSPPAHP